MIDNGHALLVPTSIFAIMLIYYLIRKFYKSNKKNKNKNSLKSSNTSDRKFKHNASLTHHYYYFVIIFIT